MNPLKSIPAELPQGETVDVAQLLLDYVRGKIDLICVLGPTASGKTKYAVGLAREMNELISLGLLEGCPTRMTEAVQLEGCEIISADSRQVYRGMDIGTGKDIAEYGEIPYHVIDVVPAGARYNVYEFQQDFIKAYKDIRSRNCVPILCGGTGLYINAVTSGYDFHTSKPLSEEGSAFAEAPEGLPSRTFFIGTLVSREVRNARIDARLDARLEEGMADEMRALLDSGVPAETLIAYGLEYKYVTQYVLGELSRDEMRLKLSTAIHQFAKRQMTWFRGMERSGVRIHWVEV